jgi:hypothetical protein
MDDRHLIYITKLWKGTMLCNLYSLKKKCTLSVEHQLVHKIFEYPLQGPLLSTTSRQWNLHAKSWKVKERKNTYLLKHKLNVESECEHSSYSSLLFIGWGASQVQFFYFCNEPIWLAHHSKKNETMKTPQNRRFYFEI